jgi:uncharacterized repeat protein (TIGR01451 family)
MTTRGLWTTVERRLARLGGILLAVGVIGLLAAPSTNAFEIPPAGDELHIQTNGPNGLMSLGDWYTNDEPGGGSGYHYLTFYVACSWPGGQAIHVDLFGPEMNGNPGSTNSDEQTGAELDPTEYELYGPGAVVGPGFSSPAPGTGIPGTNLTYNPIASGGPVEEWERLATLAAPVSCGRYVIRAEVKGTEADDQNGWRLRVGTDNDANPNNAPPANSDNPDGLFGTDDEIQAATFQISYQHEDTGSMNCKTIWELVGDVPSVSFHNFDMDDNGRVRYYAPSDTLDPDGLVGGTAGTVSGFTEWNNGTTSRGGDTISDPEPGYWRIVSCISSNNQYIQEGQTGRQALNQPPLVPIIDVNKDDGITEIARGGNATYTIDIANNSSGPTASASRNVQLTDDLPDGFTPTSCQWLPPATGTCNISGQSVTADLGGVLIAGDAAQLEIDYSVDNDASGTLTNTALVGYEDSFGNTFPPESATDSDQTFIENADLVIDKSHVGDFIYGEQGTYTLAVNNTGPNTAVDVEISDPLPAGLSFAGFTAPGWTCAEAGGTVTCDRAAPLPSGAGDSVQITVNVGAAALGGVTNSATVIALTPDPDTSDNDDDDPTNVIAATASGTVYEDLNASGTIDSPPEIGVSGWNAYVDLDGDSNRDPGEPFDATDAAGDYTITDIISGTHTVRLEPQAGWTCTFPNPCNYPAVDFTGAAQRADLDFAVWEGASISGTLYDDQDADGTLNEPGENPLTGWTVFLDIDGSGTLDAGEPTDTTDANGVYSFGGVAPGTYAVRVEPQAGWICSAPTPCLHSVTVNSGDVSTGHDFGFWVPASIAGVVFEDRDVDAAARETGEALLSGWTAYLDLDDSGSPDAGEPTDVTDAGGAYSFGGLVPGDYAVRLELQAGWTCSFPAPCENAVTVTAGQQLTGADFGVWTTASLSGTLFEDSDKDGAAREAGEPALQNWTVYLDADGNGSLDSGEQTRATDALGNYAFTGLDPGDYSVRVVVVASYTCSHPSPCNRSATVESQQSLPGQDFGSWRAEGLKPTNRKRSTGDTDDDDGTGSGGGGGGGGDLPFTGFALMGMLMTGLGLLLAGHTARPRRLRR